MKNKDILPRIYKYCAYQDRSRLEIVEKLNSYEVNEEEIPDILEDLRKERMWDEARFACSFARGKFMYKKWGRTKIRFELKKKGVPVPLIERAFKSEIEEKDYLDTLKELAEKKRKQWATKPPFEAKQKVIRYLQQRGYEWELIMQVLPY